MDKSINKRIVGRGNRNGKDDDSADGTRRISSCRPAAGGRHVARSFDPAGPGTRRGDPAGRYGGEDDGEATDKDLFRRSGGICPDGKSHQDGEGVAESVDPRTVPNHPEEGNGKGVYR